MRKLSCVLCVVLSAWPAFAQNGSGVITNSTQRVTIATDDGVATDINLIQAATSQTADDISFIRANLSTDVTHDNTAAATGPQQMLEAKDFDGSAMPNVVSAEGDAVRQAGSLYGIGYVMPVNEDGSKAIFQAEDGAHTSTDLGYMALCVRESSATDLSAGNTDGDYEPCTVDASTRLWTHEANSDSSLTSLQLIDNLVTDPCAGTAQTFVPFSFNTATTTQLIAASSNNKNYICSINIVVGGADNVALVEDDTSACASPSAGMAGGTTAATGWNFAANGGLVAGNGKGTVFKSAAANVYTCLISSAAVQASGTISYVQAP